MLNKYPQEIQKVDGVYLITEHGIELLRKEYGKLSQDIIPVADSQQHQEATSEIDSLKAENATLRIQLDNANNSLNQANQNLNQAWQFVEQVKALQAPQEETIHQLEKKSYRYKVSLVAISAVAIVIIAILAIQLFIQ